MQVTFMKIHKTVLQKSEIQLPRIRTVVAMLLASALVSFGLTGCSKKSDTSGNPTSPATAQPVSTPIALPPPLAPLTPQQNQNNVSTNPVSPAPAQQATGQAGTPVMEPVLIAWQQGDKPLAVSRFIEVNWSSRPLFASSSALSLSEKQVMALPPTDNKAKLEEIYKQMGNLRQLAQAVLQAGRDAAGSKDSAQARKYFTSLKQCGEALDATDFSLGVRQFGQTFKKWADDELGKLGQ
jgi:hypothetical protein